MGIFGTISVDFTGKINVGLLKDFSKLILNDSLGALLEKLLVGSFTVFLKVLWRNHLYKS